MHQENCLDSIDKVRILLDVAQGLTHVHQNGVIHSELKLANSLLERQSRGSCQHAGDCGRFWPVTENAAWCHLCKRQQLLGHTDIGPPRQPHASSVHCWECALLEHGYCNQAFGQNLAGHGTHCPNSCALGTSRLDIYLWQACVAQLLCNSFPQATCGKVSII